MAADPTIGGLRKIYEEMAPTEVEVLLVISDLMWTEGKGEGNHGHGYTTRRYHHKPEL